MNHSSNRRYRLFGVICLINLGLAGLFGFGSPMTAYVNGPDSPFYTLLTTHFTHHSAQHLGSNLLALWLLLILFPTQTYTIVCSFVTCVVLVSLYVLISKTHMFLGFSAFLYCLPGCYLSFSIANKNHSLSVVILTILFAYLFMIVPMTTDDTSSWKPMTHAHLLGFMAGVITAYLSLTLKNHPQRHIEYD